MIIFTINCAVTYSDYRFSGCFICMDFFILRGYKSNKRLTDVINNMAATGTIISSVLITLPSRNEEILTIIRKHMGNPAAVISHLSFASFFEKIESILKIQNVVNIE